MHRIADRLALFRVDTQSRSHLLRNLKTVRAEVGNHHVSCSGETTDCGSHRAYKSGSCDKDIFTEEREGKRGMGSVSERVHNGDKVIGNTRIDLNDIGSRNA